MESENVKKIEGVGGWLVLYIVLGFLGVLKIILSMAVFGLSVFLRFPDFFYVVLGIWNAMICFLLLKKHFLALKMVFLLLLTKMLFVALYSLIASAPLLAKLFSGGNYYPDIIDIARASGGFLMPWLWFLYFRKSRRIKATFTETFLFLSNERNAKLINAVGSGVVVISVLTSVYAVIIENQARPFLYSAMKEHNIGVLNRSDYRKVAIAKKDALQRLWESKRQ